MRTQRYPAVAGMFYPGEADVLQREVDAYLGAADSHGPAPKAIIAPHAGYIYSGPVAATVYALLAQARERITRVILLGPSHRVGFSGLALSSADQFVTPLGSIPVDKSSYQDIEELPQVQVLDRAHDDEHSLEVHLPFLQRALKSFSIVPLVVGEARPEEVAEVLDRLWGGDETLVVISSDLSHYLDYDAAVKRDRATTQAIEALRFGDIGPYDACGCRPLSGLLYLLQRYGLKVHAVDVRNSGDTAGSRDRVVGYGAYVAG